MAPEQLEGEVARRRIVQILRALLRGGDRQLAVRETVPSGWMPRVPVGSGVPGRQHDTHGLRARGGVRTGLRIERPRCFPRWKPARGDGRDPAASRPDPPADMGMASGDGGGAWSSRPRGAGLRGDSGRAGQCPERAGSLGVPEHGEPYAEDRSGCEPGMADFSQRWQGVAEVCLGRRRCRSDNRRGGSILDRRAHHDGASSILAADATWSSRRPRMDGTTLVNPACGRTFWRAPPRAEGPLRLRSGERARRLDGRASCHSPTTRESPPPARPCRARAPGAPPSLAGPLRAARPSSADSPARPKPLQRAPSWRSRADDPLHRAPAVGLRVGYDVHTPGRRRLSSPASPRTIGRTGALAAGSPSGGGRPDRPRAGRTRGTARRAGGTSARRGASRDGGLSIGLVLQSYSRGIEEVLQPREGAGGNRDIGSTPRPPRLSSVQSTLVFRRSGGCARHERKRRGEPRDRPPDAAAVGSWLAGRLLLKRKVPEARPGRGGASSRTAVPKRRDYGPSARGLAQTEWRTDR